MSLLTVFELMIVESGYASILVPSQPCISSITQVFDSASSIQFTYTLNDLQNHLEIIWFSELNSYKNF
jgi:hypothetical protein